VIVIESEKKVSIFGQKHKGATWAFRVSERDKRHTRANNSSERDTVLVLRFPSFSISQRIRETSEKLKNRMKNFFLQEETRCECYNVAKQPLLSLEIIRL